MRCSRRLTKSQNINDFRLLYVRIFYEHGISRNWGAMIDLIMTFLCGMLGVSASMVYELISTIVKRKSESKEDNIASQIKKVSKVLEDSVQEINSLQIELEKRIKLVEKLQKEAKDAENIISLTENQVKAIRTTLNSELQKESRKSFWQGVVVNFVFFVLGALVSYIVSKYLI